MLLPIALPPGVYGNGTDYEAKGRWRDANLVRWRDASLRPVGGWRTRIADAFDQPVRGMLVWEDNSGDRRVAAGSYGKLFVVSASNTVTDITPADLTAGTEDAQINFGFGGGFYGLGTYGTTRDDAGSFGEAASWSLDTWGQYLVGCMAADGRLLEWQLNTGNDAAAISNAPTDNLALVVTEERFLFALGAGGNPRNVQWSDREDNTTWTAAATNEAGSQELQTPGQCKQGIRVRGQTLILTDVDAHVATYVGPPFVYGFERVGSACGAPSRLAGVSVDGVAFWMGQRGFFTYAGGGVQNLPCEVSDVVFGDINRAQQSKIWALANQQFNEIWWFYPSEASNEIDQVVIYNYQDGWWSLGRLSRTAGVPRGVFAYNLMADSTGDLFEHEVGNARGSGSIYAESAPIDLNGGNTVTAVTHLIPDEDTQGDVTATFKTRFHPNDTEREYGPYTMANPTSVRFTGRQIRMRVTENTASDWRVGHMRVDATPMGRR